MYLCDAGLPDLPDDYTEAAIARRVVAGPEAIIVHVDREMPVPVTVQLHEARPTLDLAALDHVAQTAFDAPSGEIVLAGLLDHAPDAPRFPVPATRLGVIVTFAALGSLSDDGLEGEDAYAIHLWPDPTASSEVIVAKSTRRLRAGRVDARFLTPPPRIVLSPARPPKAQMTIQSVLLPVLVEVALVFVLLGLLAAVRKAAMREHRLAGKDIALSDDAFPARARQVSNCYKNQFEMPVLFLFAVIFGIELHQTGWLFVLLEWVFVACRIAHAVVHTGANPVRLRGALFLGSAAATALMWVLIFVGVFFGTVIG